MKSIFASTFFLFSRSVFFTILGGFVLSGCGSHVDKLEGSDSPVTSTPTPTYAWLRENLFLTRCVGCHSNQRSAGGVNVVTMAALLGSSGAVTPNKPEASHLFTELRDHKMPPPAKSPAPPTVAVPDPVVEMVRQWIANGANQ